MLKPIFILAGVLTMSIYGTSEAFEKLPKPDKDLPAGKPGESKSVVLAGGCFWCTEGAFRQIKGISTVISGYAGDTKEKANYKIVCSGATKHAEAIKIVYDPAQISYGQLLQVFFTAHDPTTKDRQGNDRGPQYRSAIFIENDEQKKVTESYIQQLNKANAFTAPIVTTLEPLTEFFAAEDYHQDFVTNNPDQGYVRQCSLPKMKKVRDSLPELLKK